LNIIETDRIVDTRPVRSRTVEREHHGPRIGRNRLARSKVEPDALPIANIGGKVKIGKNTLPITLARRG